MPEIELAGCTPEPLMNYLKALGVFRLVAEQCDPDARLSWDGGVARLDSQLDRDGLEIFLLETYSPSPIVGPWGARSGFYPGSSESAARRSSSMPSWQQRTHIACALTMFRDVIQSIRDLLSRLGYGEKVKDEDKLTLMPAFCRNNLADELLPWLDAVFILTEDSRRFPPLLVHRRQRGEWKLCFDLRSSGSFATNRARERRRSGQRAVRRVHGIGWWACGGPFQPGRSRRTEFLPRV